MKVPLSDMFQSTLPARGATLIEFYTQFRYRSQVPEGALSESGNRTKSTAIVGKIKASDPQMLWFSKLGSGKGDDSLVAKDFREMEVNIITAIGSARKHVR